MMPEFQLRAAGSFFDNNNKYNTWLAPPQAPTEKRKEKPTNSTKSSSPKVNCVKHLMQKESLTERQAIMQS